MNILHIDSAITPNSASRELTAHIVALLLQADADAQVTHLDLHAQPVPHLNADSLALRNGQEASTDAERTQNALTEQLLTQFLAADTIVVGAPMYNFTVPSQLKAWLDRVAQAGRTFRYTAKGPEGLAGGRTVIVASSRGGAYHGTPMEDALDFQESYLKLMFGFMGITDVKVVRAQGLGMTNPGRDAVLAQAKADAAQLLQPQPVETAPA